MSTPLVLNEKVSSDLGDILEKPATYKSLVGNLLYLTATRPDLMFSVGLLSRYMNSPTHIHMGTRKIVLRYLKGTISAGIWYKRDGLVKLQDYYDSDWVGCLYDMKSTSGYIFILEFGANCWSARSRKLLHNQQLKQIYISVIYCKPSHLVE